VIAGFRKSEPVKKSSLSLCARAGVFISPFKSEISEPPAKSLAEHFGKARASTQKGANSLSQSVNASQFAIFTLHFWKKRQVDEVGRKL
jgi:hypothetical protein